MTHITKCPCCGKKVTDGYSVYVLPEGTITTKPQEGATKARMGWICYKKFLASSKKK